MTRQDHWVTQKTQKSLSIAQFMHKMLSAVGAILSWLRLVAPCHHCEHLATISLTAEFSEAVSFNQPSQEPHRTLAHPSDDADFSPVHLRLAVIVCL